MTKPVVRPEGLDTAIVLSAALHLFMVETLKTLAQREADPLAWRREFMRRLHADLEAAQTVDPAQPWGRARDYLRGVEEACAAA